MRVEIWKPVVGCEGFYEVSSMGRIKSLHGKGRFIKLQINRSGYWASGMIMNGKKVFKSVHRLMAIAFLENPENKPAVNHKNGIKTDNNLDNLEWCTFSENTIHAIKTGLTSKPWSKRGGPAKNHIKCGHCGAEFTIIGWTKKAIKKFCSVKCRMEAQVIHGKYRRKRAA